jgi:hypothetical protein
MEALLLSVLTDFQPGRLAESLIFLSVLLWKTLPHFKKLEAEMKGVREELGGVKDAMKAGFDAGEKRFENHELRIEKLESENIAP